MLPPDCVRKILISSAFSGVEDVSFMYLLVWALQLIWGIQINIQYRQNPPPTGLRRTFSSLHSVCEAAWLIHIHLFLQYTACLSWTDMCLSVCLRLTLVHVTRLGGLWRVGHSGVTGSLHDMHKGFDYKIDDLYWTSVVKFFFWGGGEYHSRPSVCFCVIAFP